MPRRVLQGTVVSDGGDKTITVRVERRFMHTRFKKYITKSKKYAAQDETTACKLPRPRSTATGPRQPPSAKI